MGCSGGGLPVSAKNIPGGLVFIAGAGILTEGSSGLASLPCGTSLCSEIEGGKAVAETAGRCKMKDREFREVLEKAVRGDKVAMEQIFILYKPMIDHASVVNGKLDEDFRQEIFLHLVTAIPKFAKFMD